MPSAPSAEPDNAVVAAILAWSRRIDQFIFGIRNPPAEPSWGSIGAGALSLWSNMAPSTPNKLTAQLVHGTDGTSRVVVSMTGMQDNLSDALMGNTGWLNPTVSDFVDQAYEDWGLSSHAEVMLVGFSNGGQQMQNYAATGKYGDRVAVLVFFGAPLTKTADEYAADSLLIQDLGDRTYGLYTHDDAVDSYNIDDSDLKAIYTTGEVLTIDTHTLETYQRAAEEFDSRSNEHSSPADWSALATEIAKFAGTVTVQPRVIRTV